MMIWSLDNVMLCCSCSNRKIVEGGRPIFWEKALYVMSPLFRRRKAANSLSREFTRRQLAKFHSISGMFRLSVFEELLA